ncbi:unnamed protein product [Coffea canephora]|uniref:DH200=94 genomic scaffold, scaffold_328 n=1 Tax=Coffea canephora TaxID=49390 RepID=A0A068VE58_COFCA|nr:unnamed protein product [Coffea canephora]
MIKNFQPILHSALVYIDDILLFKILFLGMKISNGTCTPEQQVGQSVKDFPEENLTKTQVQQFLGLVNYVREFIPKAAKHISPLTKMLKKAPPSWGSSQTQAIQKLKQELVNLPTLHIPTEGKKILQTDASDKYWGAVLLEEDNKGTRHYCGFSSGKFKAFEQHYHSIFKEILAIRNGIKKFSFFLISHHFLVEMDMGSFPKMLHFKQKSVPHPQLLRWSAWFSQYSFDVKHIKGKKNIVADFFSRKEPIPQQVLYCLMFTSVQPVTAPPSPKVNQRVWRIACPTLARTRSLSSSEIRYNLETKRKIIPKLKTYIYIHIHLNRNTIPIRTKVLVLTTSNLIQALVREQ